VREHPVQQFEMAGAAGDLVADGGPVSLRLRRPIEAPEDSMRKSGCSAVCDQSIQRSTCERAPGSSDQKRPWRAAR
jgi:hypothetical protein